MSQWGWSTAKLTNFTVWLEGVTDDVIIAAPRDIPSRRGWKHSATRTGC